MEGQQVPEMFCLVTGLMDWEDYPGPELASRYKWRWDGSETALREAKAPLRGAGRSRVAAGTSPVSTATITSRPAQAGTGNGGVPARRAVIRWAWRLFRREWRQQLLVLGLLTVAVAATIWRGRGHQHASACHRDLRHRHRRDQPAGQRPAPGRRDRTDRQELRPDRRDREPGPEHRLDPVRRAAGAGPGGPVRPPAAGPGLRALPGRTRPGGADQPGRVPV
ncbi:MAG TPA: hypothetical protein VIY52_02740 [Streptosporangiaceae bacterium]